MIPSSIISNLFILGLELYVHLGWEDSERQQTQKVFLDIEIFFSEPPQACRTDQLDDTICYSELSNLIQDKIASQKKFRLVEHLSKEIYQLIKPQFIANTKIIVRVKKHPNIPGLTGGVCFTYGDA